MTYANLPYDYQYLVDTYVPERGAENWIIPGILPTDSERIAFWKAIGEAKTVGELPEIPQAQYTLIQSLPRHYKLYVPPQARKFFYAYVGKPHIKEPYYIQTGDSMSSTDDVNTFRSSEVPTIDFYKYFEVKPVEKTLPDTFKIQVNPDQSRVLQEKLFENGSCWGGATYENRKLKHLGTPWLKVYNGVIRRFGTKESFDANNVPEIIFEDYFPDAEPVGLYTYHQQLHNAAEIMATIPFHDRPEFINKLYTALSNAADTALDTVEEEVCKLRQQLADKENELELIRSYKNNLNLQK